MGHWRGVGLLVWLGMGCASMKAAALAAAGEMALTSACEQTEVQACEALGKSFAHWASGRDKEALGEAARVVQANGVENLGAVVQVVEAGAALAGPDGAKIQEFAAFVRQALETSGPADRGIGGASPADRGIGGASPADRGVGGASPADRGVGGASPADRSLLGRGSGGSGSAGSAAMGRPAGGSIVKLITPEGGSWMCFDESAGRPVGASAATIGDVAYLCLPEKDAVEENDLAPLPATALEADVQLIESNIRVLEQLALSTEPATVRKQKILAVKSALLSEIDEFEGEFGGAVKTEAIRLRAEVWFAVAQSIRSLCRPAERSCQRVLAVARKAERRSADLFVKCADATTSEPPSSSVRCDERIDELFGGMAP